MKHNHITRDIKPKGGCPGCDEYWSAQPVKNIVKRVVEAYAEIDPATYVFSAGNIDLLDDESIADFIARQKTNGDTAYDFAKEMDLFENITIHLSLVEHYDDDTSRHVEGGEWSDSSDD